MKNNQKIENYSIGFEQNKSYQAKITNLLRRTSWIEPSILAAAEI